MITHDSKGFYERIFFSFFNLICSKYRQLVRKKKWQRVTPWPNALEALNFHLGLALIRIEKLADFMYPLSNFLHPTPKPSFSVTLSKKIHYTWYYTFQNRSWTLFQSFHNVSHQLSSIIVCTTLNIPFIHVVQYVISYHQAYTPSSSKHFKNLNKNIVWS